MDSVKRMVEAELRNARAWLIGVGVVMFVSDMVGVWAFGRGPQDGASKIAGTVMSAAILGVYVVLWFFVPRRPRLCLATGLAVFWGLQLLVAVDHPASLFSGLLFKAIFTGGLIAGLTAARHVETLRKEAERGSLSQDPRA